MASATESVLRAPTPRLIAITRPLASLLRTLRQGTANTHGDCRDTLQIRQDNSVALFVLQENTTQAARQAVQGSA